VIRRKATKCGPAGCIVQKIISGSSDETSSTPDILDSRACEHPTVMVGCSNGWSRKNSMQLSNVRPIDEFIRKHSQARFALEGWQQKAAAAQWDMPTDVTQTFKSAECVRGVWLFNIGRSVRLAASIQFEMKAILIKMVMTHDEYNKGGWKNEQ